MNRLPRFLLPGLWSIPLLIALSWIMDHGRGLGIPLLLVDVASVVFFAIVAAAPLVLYPIAFSRGYRLGERIAASLVPLAWWWLTEVAGRMEFNSPLESVFLSFSVVNYLHYQLIALQLIAAELACRCWRKRRRDPETAVFSRGLGLAATAALLVALTDLFALEAYFKAHEALFHTLFARDELPLPERFVGPLPAGAASLRRGSERPPNLVFILSDDHRWDYMRNSGHPFVETPALDRLANEGVRFNNAFVTTSICSPSRASFATGLRAERHGVLNNFTPWNDRNRTFFEYLKQAGYATAFIGKWHMPGELPELRGVDRFVTFTALTGQGYYFDCPLIVDGKPTPSVKRYIAEELTDRAIAFIETHREGPFALHLAHKNVHHPFLPDESERGLYRDREIELPETAHSWVNWTHSHYEQLVALPMQWSMRNYSEAVVSMDREIGRILDAIDALGIRNDTAVIYASDNGYLWGERQLIDKRWAYEESIRIPFLLRYPALVPRGGVESDRLILNVDLAPTLLDLAGLEIPEYMQGRSILPLLRDPGSPWRDEFYYSYYREAPFPAPTQRAIRTERHKYIEFEAKEPELYDLQRDPEERDDLIGTAEGERLREELAPRLRALQSSAEEDPALRKRPSPPE